MLHEREDRNKIAAWKALVNDAGTAMTPASCNMDLATRLGATPENVATPMTSITTKVTPDLDGADMYSVMAVLSAACNYNPVIVLKYPPSYAYTGLGITADSHTLSHRLDNASLTGTCYPNALNLLETIDKYYASNFAKLVGMLDGIKNADGSTLLDSSAAVWFNEMSDGLAQNLNNLPIIQGRRLWGLLQDGVDRERRHGEHGFGDADAGEQRSAVRTGSDGEVTGLTHPPETIRPSRTRQSTNTITT